MATYEQARAAARKAVTTPAQAYRYAAECLQLTVDELKPVSWSQFTQGQVAAAESTIRVLESLAKTAEQEAKA
ncbi:MAG: hypothetical protein WC322_02960 [Candidatus Paceibacterota bacterium]|jgi:hypothetical protein